jgi:hypothetical protein
MEGGPGDADVTLVGCCVLHRMAHRCRGPTCARRHRAHADVAAYLDGAPASAPGSASPAARSDNGAASAVGEIAGLE